MKPVRPILIAGGGSSGWMAAAFISRILHDVETTLVESRQIPTIGVGEATVPFINNFFARIGFPDFRSWVPQCDATLKTGIVFENWYAKGDRYLHPFEYLPYIDLRHHVGHCWLHWHRNRSRNRPAASRSTTHSTAPRSSTRSATGHPLRASSPTISTPDGSRASSCRRLSGPPCPRLTSSTFSSTRAARSTIC